MIKSSKRVEIIWVIEVIIGDLGGHVVETVGTEVNAVVSTRLKISGSIESLQKKASPAIIATTREPVTTLITEVVAVLMAKAIGAVSGLMVKSGGAVEVKTVKIGEAAEVRTVKIGEAVEELMEKIIGAVAVKMVKATTEAGETTTTGELKAKWMTSRLSRILQRSSVVATKEAATVANVGVDVTEEVTLLSTRAS